MVRSGNDWRWLGKGAAACQDRRLEGDVTMARRTAKPTAKAAKPAGIPSDLARDFKRVLRVAAATKLPEIEDTRSYGTPSLKVKGKFLLRVREPDVLVLMCSLEEKEFLIQNNGAIYFETDHYKGWPAVLIRLSKIDDAELKHRFQIAWRMQVPKKVLAMVDGGEAKPVVKAKKKPPKKK